jgi:hypothetical protein
MDERKRKERKKEEETENMRICVVRLERAHTGVVFNERRKHVRELDDIPVWALIHTTGRTTLAFRSSVFILQIACTKGRG